MIAFICALICGVLSGAGVGGGTILMAYLIAIRDMDALHAGLTNLIYFICSAPFALYSHFKSGIIDKKAGLTAGAAGCAGVMLASLIPRTDMKTVSAVLFLVIGLKELFASRKKDGENNNLCNK